jgi:hypothetical protein
MDDFEQHVMTMFNMSDSYPSGLGNDLHEFLKGMQITRGISLSRVPDQKTANGMECLAAQLVARFKTGVGGIYIYSPEIVETDAQFIYVLNQAKSKEDLFATADVWMRVFEGYHPKFKMIFDGLAKDYDPARQEVRIARRVSKFKLPAQLTLAKKDVTVTPERMDNTMRTPAKFLLVPEEDIDALVSKYGHNSKKDLFIEAKEVVTDVKNGNATGDVPGFRVFAIDTELSKEVTTNIKTAVKKAATLDNGKTVTNSAGLR